MEYNSFRFRGTLFLSCYVRRVPPEFAVIGYRLAGVWGVIFGPPAPLWKVGRSTAPIDDRDREILMLLSEHRVMVVPQLAIAFVDISERALAARLRRLARSPEQEPERGGLLAVRQIFKGQPASVWITRDGLGAIESGIRAQRVDYKTYRHDIGVGWLYLAARQGVFGTLTDLRLERELRSADRRGDREGPNAGVPAGIGVGAYTPDGRPSRHYPDLLMTTGTGHRVAVELELTAKSSDRLRRIMRAYASDHRVAAVLYLVPDAQGARRIETAARRAGIASLVHVQRLADAGIHGAPPPIAAGRAPIAGGRSPRSAGRDPARARAEVAR